MKGSVDRHPFVGRAGWRLARPQAFIAIRRQRNAEARRWVAARLRRLRRAGALSLADWALLRQAAVVLLMAGLTLSVVLSLGRQQRGLDLAGAGRCYIVEDGGVRWHAVRQCPALWQVPNVEETTIAQAMARGEGIRWQRPCRLCGTLLREHAAARDKRDEYEQALLDLAYHEDVGTVAKPQGGP